MAKLEEIEEALRKAKEPLSPKEIAQLTGINANTVRGRLFYLHRESKVKRVRKGLYEHA